jgi:hypothetical protein
MRNILILGFMDEASAGDVRNTENGDWGSVEWIFFVS